MQANIPGKYQNSIKAKIQNISELHPELPLSELNIFSYYQDSFNEFLLGKIHSTLPLHQMAIDFGLIDESRRKNEVASPTLARKGKLL